MNSGCGDESGRSMRHDSLNALASVLVTAAFINLLQHKVRTLKIVVTPAGAHVTRATPVTHAYQQEIGQETRPVGWISQVAMHFRRMDIPEPLVAAKVLPSSRTLSFTLSLTASFTLARVLCRTLYVQGVPLAMYTLCDARCSHLPCSRGAGTVTPWVVQSA